MRQIRLATGKYAPRIQRLLILFDSGQQALSSELFKKYSGQLVLVANETAAHGLLENFKLADSDQPLTTSRLYIIDPQGNLMMSYPADTDPRGIIKDFVRLLKYTRAGGWSES